MRRIVLLLSIVLFALVNIQAQQNERRREAIKQRVSENRVAFIKERLALTPEEEKAFWPLYNDFNQKKDAIKERVRDQRRAQRRSGEPDYEKLNDMNVQMLVDEANLTSDYYQKLKKVLPAQKIHQLFVAEKDFKKQLLDKVRGKVETRE